MHFCLTTYTTLNLSVYACLCPNITSGMSQCESVTPLFIGQLSGYTTMSIGRLLANGLGVDMAHGMLRRKNRTSDWYDYVYIEFSEYFSN